MRIPLSVLLILLIASSCVTHDLSPSEFDCSTSDLMLSLTETGAASACGVADGFISVNATGGVPPYLYSLGGISQSTGTFQNLVSGIYSVTVSDETGCSYSLSNISINASGFSFEANVQEDTDCTHGNGSIDIVVNDGEGPFQFRFGEGDFTENSSFNSLKSGSYTIVLKDANECSAILDVTVPKGLTGTSWTATIQPLITTYCALNGCHNGTSRPDLRVYSKAKFYANQIKKLTQDRSMPFEGSLTQQQIDLIACWVDEGALDN